MARLIDADALVIEDLLVMDRDYINEFASGVRKVMNEIRRLPIVDAVEVVHGEWSTIEDDYCGLTALHCSVCNQEYWFEEEPPTKIYNYCPNCGAKMDGGSDDET